MDNSQFPSQGQSVDGLYGVGQDTLVQRAVQRTFLWMTLGLAITGLASVYTVDSGLVFRMLEGNIFYQWRQPLSLCTQCLMASH